MAIQVTSFLVPKGGNRWYVLEDKYIKGGLQVVADIAERDGIDEENRKAGMIVVVQTDGKMYQLESSLTSWREFSTGGAGGGSGIRQTVNYLIEELAGGSSTDFSLDMGRTNLILALSVDTPCEIEAFGTSARDETNPYKFVATSDHLLDDGSTILPDGSVWRGRRYSTFVNMESGNSTEIYFRAKNTDEFPKNITLSIQFLPQEALSI